MKIFGWIAIAIVLIGILSVGNFVCNWFGRAATVVSQQVDPQELLRKYEWFKDAAAALDAKVANIQVYDQRFKQMEDTYKGTLRKDWPRDDREQYNLWQSEVSGVRASYNLLAAEYNSAMSKINYRFCNVGDLPKGADKPLPREYKPYIIQ
jgi:two-component SAPR family response regulator